MLDVWNDVISPRLAKGTSPAFICANSSDGHGAVLLLEDLLGPDVLLATSLDGQPLDRRHGAPLRLVSPGQYGYKSVKHLVGLVLYAQKPPSVLGPKEHLRARVVQEERHERLPPWALRRAYRALIPVTTVLAERSLRRADHPPATSDSAVRSTAQRLASRAAAVLVAGAASAHAYWALGGSWPGRDEASLAQRVIGDATAMPHPSAIWLLCIALSGAALLLLDAGRSQPSIPSRWSRASLRILVVATSLRALAGFITSAVALSRGTEVPYFLLDVLIFSPLCAALAALSAVAVPPRGAPGVLKSNR